MVLEEGFCTKCWVYAEFDIEDHETLLEGDIAKRYLELYKEEEKEKKLQGYQKWVCSKCKTVYIDIIINERTKMPIEEWFNFVREDRKAS